MGLSLRQLAQQMSIIGGGTEKNNNSITWEGGAGGGLGMSSPPWEGPAPLDPRVRIGICYNSYIYLLPQEPHIS